MRCVAFVSGGLGFGGRGHSNGAVFNLTTLRLLPV